MTSIYELKLGSQTLEALKFLLTQTNELESAIKAINLNEVNQINSNITTAKNIIESIKSSFEAKKSEFDTNFNEARQIQSEVRANKEFIDSAKISIESMQSDIALKKDVVVANKEQIAEYKQSVESSISRFYTANNEATQKLDEMREISRSVLGAKDELSQTKQEALNAIDDSLDRLTNALEAISQDRATINADKQEIGATAQTLTQLKNELTTLKSQLEATISEGVVNDTTISQTQTYSSQKIASELQSAKDEISESLKSKGYQTSEQVQSAIISKGYLTDSEVENKITSKGYITQTQSDDRYLQKSEKATDSNLLDGKDSTAFVLKSELNALAPSPDLSGYATQSWANSQFRTSSQVESAITSKGYLTQSTADSRYLKPSDTSTSPSSGKVVKYDGSNINAYGFKLTNTSTTSMGNSNHPAFIDSSGYIKKATISNYLSALNVYTKSECDSKYATKTQLGNYLTQSTADSRYQRIGSSSSGALTKANLVSELFKTTTGSSIDLSSGVNFYLSGSSNSTISVSNTSSNKGKSGIIYIRNAFSGFDSNFNIINVSDLDVKNNCVFSYFINPANAKVELIYVGVAS